jgi:hypothetical protein
VAAPGYGRNEIVHCRDEFATDERQVPPASNMWEYLMLAKHSFGQANRVAWRHRVSSHDVGIAEKSSAQAHWLEREQQIEHAIAALAKLDDRTLLGLGISHRSHIEWTVRYCHDC